MSKTQRTIESRRLPSAKELADMKKSLGEILLALQCPLTPKERQELWQYLESLLEQYVDENRRQGGGANQ